MNFTEKYVSQTEKTANPSDRRIVLSDDAYAQCEMINDLNFRLSRLVK